MNADALLTQPARRAGTYWLLASLFATAPDQACLVAMARAARGPSPQEHRGEDPLLAGFHRALPTVDDFGALTARLAAEHTRLFGGIRDGSGAPPPFESLWREGQLMGQCTVAVAAAYRDAGYQPGGDWVPFDHIVEELRFIAALCHAEHEAMLSGNDAEMRWLRLCQAQFIAEHLQPWVPHYCNEMAEAAREPFFVALAQATTQTLGAEGRWLSRAAAA